MTVLGDGGARQGDADLWCSYAAVRTLAWLGDNPADADGVAGYLRSRQNADGGFAWQRGLPSDAWATYYCSQALRDLGEPVPHLDKLGEWLDQLRTDDGGFAMTPGQSADIWATYYACRTYAEALGAPVPRVEALAGWLAATQHESGGLGWQPGDDRPDVRAGYYGALAWRAAVSGAGTRGNAGAAGPPWRTAELVRWLRHQQCPDGGFGFGPGAASCAWATFRAVRALAALGAGPADVAAVRRWLSERWLPTGGYERWVGYGRADVWACFSAVGALDTLGHRLTGARRAGVARFVRSCQLPGSGFTYRDPAAAGDSLATAAALITGTGPDRAALAGWLHAAHLPYEGGIMYMPGRGAEVRCTLWAVEALATVGERLDGARLAGWLRDLQNPDGGYGYWLGRGSDLVSTASAVEATQAAGLTPAEVLDVAGALRFVAGCAGDGAYRPVPGAVPTLSATAQAARVLQLLGEPEAALRVGRSLAAWASSLGGHASAPRGLPDLMSTYQAVLTQQVLGLPVDRAGLGRLLAKVRTGAGYSWSPISQQPAGPLADCLGVQLAAVAAGAPVTVRRLNL
ncbi:MAG TPA: prenyltransferase/squalene oxidase repeat-containing protein [Mycobacteriales bacterium]|nr:prenyltransferase/squalene oxidase repeat-containing protein [Mycobacteriales bacterium]